MRFSKWHGLGNEYLLLDRREIATAIDSQLVKRLCDQHTGIGADGVLEIANVADHGAETVIWNPDGSLAELSGNGTRIVARWLARELDVEQVDVIVGDRVVHARMRGGLLVDQDMGAVVVGEPETLALTSESVEFTPVSVGNPHAVVRHDPGEREVVRLGPQIEGHKRFPERTNVQLVRVDGPSALTVGVWERGAGLTASSGTSSCAAVAAACAHGWVESPVTVALPGGELHVALSRAGATLTGPAQEICTGQVSPELLAEFGRDASG